MAGTCVPKATVPEMVLCAVDDSDAAGRVLDAARELAGAAPRPVVVLSGPAAAAAVAPTLSAQAAGFSRDAF